ncbi:MAG: Hsp33 family molecular chaperone HslO [Acidobacteria bacterium]|nr:Hsp33 family molecular chaperone HslO [Acidobacteriota bacterium]
MEGDIKTLGEGELLHGIAGAGDLRWVVVDLGTAVEALRLRRDLAPLAAVSLGQLLTGTALLQRMMTKTPMRLGVELRGDGPLGRMTAEIDDQGNLRGTVGQIHAEAEDGRLGISSGIGQGTLRVIRQGAKATYESQVELVPEGIGASLAHYLEQSEQVRAAVLVGVLARPDGISAAGGLIVEALPGADEDLLSGLEERIRGCGEIGRILESGGIDALLDGVLGSLDRESLGRYPVRYACGCDRGSLLSRLRALPQEDLDYLLEQPGGTEAECVYCGTVYLFTPEELAAAQ